MKKHTPLVTVLMTAYNAEPYIGQAIESILNQTFADFEFIIVDDGSRDNTSSVVKTYIKKDKRIHLISLEDNEGPSNASNIGIMHAKGTYIARMDADDIAFSNRLGKQVAYLEKHPDVVLLGGQCVLIDETNAAVGYKRFPTRHKAIYEALFRINPIQHPSCMINTKLLPNGHVFYQNVSVLAHDLELVFELAQYGKLANLRDNVLYYRQYDSSLSLKNPKLTFKATLEVRHRAVIRHGYLPTTKGKVMNTIQKMVVTVLPSEAIYPLFVLLRMRNRDDYRKALRSILYFIRGSLTNRFLTFKSSVATAIVKS